MSKGADTSGSSEARRWAIPAVIAILLVLLFLVFALPRLIGVYQLYYGSGSIERLLHDELGFSRSWSSFLGVVAGFIYALVWVPLGLWTYRLVVWRFNGKQLAIAFICWVAAYGHAPLLHATLGSSACFNQRTGEPMKWYVQAPNGQIILFDSAGYDSLTRAEKKPVTPEVCAAYANQAANLKPQRLSGDISKFEFFDPVTGRPRIWYHRMADNTIELFSSGGFHPVTSAPLLPVTREIVVEVLRDADRIAAQERQQRQRLELERTERERAERERLERERADRDRDERERVERERRERERLEFERNERDRKERDKIQREQVERERIQREREERERAERDRIIREREIRDQKRMQAYELVRRDRCQALAVCRPGFVFSLTSRDCILIQHYGGTIPGSEDDKRYDPQRGWVPNCPSR